MRENYLWLGLGIAVVLAYVIATILMVNRTVDVRQFEKTMPEGTKVTCFVTVGTRNAAISCIPHEVFDVE
jgi:hypothetical protein